MPNGVGATLRQRREERHISLRQIAAATKISPGALEAIERDDIKRLPGGIFVRSFVRTYAAELQLDPERTLAEFLAQFPEIQAESAGATPKDAPRLAHIWRVAAQLAVIVLPLTAVVVWALIGGRARESRLDTDRALVVRPDAEPAAVLHPASSPAAAPPEAVPAMQETTMRVVLTMKSDCWVSASADSRPVVERLVHAGESVELTATRSVVFKAGDAGAVTLQINGETGRSLGRAGEVVTARIDPSNVHDFLATP